MSDQVRQIAMRIADLREISDYTIEQMAQALCVSTQEYRTYESGETDIPISFLLKISEVFHVDMTELLTGEAPRLNLFSVTRAGKGHDIIRANHYIYKNLAYNFLHRKIEPLYVVVPTTANRDMVPNSHSGQEFDYILEGTMRIMVDGHEIFLNPGDSIYYDSRLPHAMQAKGLEPVHLLAMVIPE
jgi:transcriptional regulator with XRE-family HTH domain